MNELAIIADFGLGSRSNGGRQECVLDQEARDGIVEMVLRERGRSANGGCRLCRRVLAPNNDAAYTLKTQEDGCVWKEAKRGEE